MPLNFHGSFQPRKELSETKLISFVLFSPAFIRVVICHDINAFEMSFLLMYKLRSRFLLLLFLFLGISNILIIINYQYATKSSKYFVDSKDQNQELLLVNWKGLQIEIDTTFHMPGSREEFQRNKMQDNPKFFKNFCTIPSTRPFPAPSRADKRSKRGATEKKIAFCVLRRLI